MISTHMHLPQADFLTLDMASEELSEVRGVILDPSCSGSGTRHSRMDHLLPSKGLASEADEASRLASLAAFQVGCCALLTLDDTVTSGCVLEQTMTDEATPPPLIWPHQWWSSCLCLLSVTVPTRLVCATCVKQEAPRYKSCTNSIVIWAKVQAGSLTARLVNVDLPRPLFCLQHMKTGWLAFC